MRSRLSILLLLLSSLAFAQGNPPFLFEHLEFKETLIRKKDSAVRIEGDSAFCRVQISLDTVSAAITGDWKLQMINNSPDTLWFFGVRNSGGNIICFDVSPRQIPPQGKFSLRGGAARNPYDGRFQKGIVVLLGRTPSGQNVSSDLLMRLRFEGVYSGAKE